MEHAITKRIWVKNPLAILVPEGVDARGGLVIHGSTIEEILGVNEQPSKPCTQTLDAADLVVIPGLINTHHHFYQTLTRAFPTALNKELFPWLKSLYPVWAGLTPEDIAVSTELALAELLLSGCTTAADHHYVFPKGLENAIDIQVSTAQNMGMRAVFTRGSMSLSQKDGGLPPDTTVQDDDTILADSERLIKQHHQTDPGAMTQIALAPCSPFSVSKSLMTQTAALAEKLDVRLHTHLAETHDEADFCEQKMGMTPVDFLEDTGWLNNKTWLAHGIHFSDSEIGRLGKAGVGICHCPSSNMILASGIASTKQLEAAGAAVGLGVDGSASNDGSNMIQEVRQALLLQRLKYGSSNVTHFDAYRWATEGSARCLGREDIGTLEVGKQADIAMFSLNHLRFSGSGDPLAAVLLCGAHKAEHVMVAGNWKVSKGELVGVDQTALMQRHKRCAEALAAKALKNF